MVGEVTEGTAVLATGDEPRRTTEQPRTGGGRHFVVSRGRRQGRSLGGRHPGGAPVTQRTLGETTAAFDQVGRWEATSCSPIADTQVDTRGDDRSRTAQCYVAEFELLLMSSRFERCAKQTDG